MSREKVIEFIYDLPKSSKDMAERFKKIPFSHKFFGFVTTATLVACGVGEKIGIITPPPEGSQNPPTTETTPTTVVINIENMIPVPENFRGSNLSGEIVGIESLTETENTVLSRKAQDALIRAGEKYNIEGGTTYLISNMNLIDSNGNRQNLTMGLVLDNVGEGITPTPDPQGNVLVPLSAMFFYTESDGLAFVPPGEGLDIAGERMLPLGYWQDENTAYLGFGVEGSGATLPVFEMTSDGKVIYHDPYSGLSIEVQQNQFPVAIGKALYSLLPIPNTPTPEIQVVKEYIPGGIRLEESLAGLDLEISPQADQEAIYDTIVASFVRFLKKDQNNEAWQKVLEAHPEWAHLTNSDPEEIRTQAMNEFLRQTGGRIYINFMGGTGYTREGWVDLTKRIVFQAGEVTAMPNDHVRIEIRDPKRTGDVIATGAGGKVFAEEEQLIYSILLMPYQIEDTVTVLGWNEGMAVSSSFVELVEAQADQSISNPAIPQLKEPFTTDPILFIWGNGNESFWPRWKGFTDSFIISINK